MSMSHILPATACRAILVWLGGHASGLSYCRIEHVAVSG